MQNLITNEQVISLAFGDGEYVSPNVVHDSDIAAATYRYIIPIVGEKLYEEMVEGSHQTLLSDYVAPALAMAVRTMIQPALNVRTGQGGLVIPSSARADTSTRGVTNALHKSLRLRRQTLLRRLSDYLRSQATEFASYDVEGDIMQKCRINGGYIQGC
jgi:hypothetical protein